MGERAHLLASRSPLRWRIAEKPPDTLDRLAELRQRACIRKAQIALAMGTKTGPGDGCHPGFVEKPRLQSLGVEASPRDIGKGIEGAARIDAAEARQPVERGDD